MPEPFTETLRATSEAGWSRAVRHRFVNELFAGAVPDAVMARYLIQDHRFLDSFLTLLGATLASADTFEARVRFGRFIGMVSGEENTFFLRAFEALGVTEDRRTTDPDTQPTAGFKAIMREAAETRSYAAALSVLVVAEWLYLDWASRAPQPLPVNFVRAEWITLHDNPGFRGFVDFLRAELTASAPRKTSFSPVISEGFDRSNGIYDRTTGEVVAQGELGPPIFVGVMQFTTQAVIERRRDLEPGDVILVNDPYLGGTHLMDVKMVRPFYYRGRLWCYLSNTGHWPDTGAMLLGVFPATATEIVRRACVCHR